MSRIDSSTAAPAQNGIVGNSIEDLDLSVFLDLVLTQLQSQDPLNPLENDELLNTITQIREIGANDQLSETLDSVLLGQNVATAANLIGTEVEGLTDAGRRVTGAVRQVSINDGAPVLELAVETFAEAGPQPGLVEPGTYQYEVVWETDDGVFSVQVEANTEDFGEDFQGSVRLDNLPPVDGGVTREVYRTDGSGPPRLLGRLNSSSATSFVDTLADEDLRPETLDFQRNVLRFADAVEVSLNNVARVQTLE